jgi:Ca2+-binding RTX toxin-like protein
VSGGRSGNRPAEATLHLETLEQRLPLAVSTCSLDALSGILAIRCDDTNSRVDLRVTQTGQGVTAIVRLQVLENGRTVRGQFPLSQVRKIEFTGGIRDDLFNAAAVSLRVQAVGNDGNDTLVGGRGANTLDGGNGRDTLRAVGSSVMYGQDGDDTITTGDSDDVIEGGDGNDRITSGGGRDTIYAGRGNDQVNAGSGEDEIHGEDGNDGLTGGDSNDRIAGGAGVDVIFGGNGDDTLSGGNDGDIIQGDAGADTINGEAGNDLLAGGEGDDAISGGTGTDTINGDAGGDRLFGGDDADTIRGGIGNDFINGESGHDVIYGDADNDSILGGTGNDRIDGGFGSDTINGESDLDALSGGDGNDILLGGTGNDTLQGNAGNDTVVGEDGDDTIDGGSGNDTLRGGGGDDTLDGESGADRMTGNSGYDTLRGGPGRDLLNGGDQIDNLDGGTGDDWLVGIDDFGFDRLVGGAGKDAFWRDLGTLSSDLVADLSAADVDNGVRAFANPGADRTLDGDSIAGPAFTAGLATASFSANPLFSAFGPRGTDINQGVVSDCKVVAGLAALARDTAGDGGWAIRRSMVDFGDGTYGIHLGENFFRVDAVLPLAPGSTVPNYANLGAGDSIWVSIAEKAIALADQRTPGSPNYADLSSTGADEVFTLFGSATTGVPLIGTTYASAAALGTDIVRRFRSAAPQYLTVSLSDSSNGTLGQKFVVGHAYTVWSLNFNNAGALASVVLRNPWGSDTGNFAVSYTDANANDGLVTITVGELFSSVGRLNWATRVS